MISLRVAVLVLLFGLLLFLAMRTPGVLVYDYIAHRLRGRGRPPQDLSLIHISCCARPAPSSSARP